MWGRELNISLSFACVNRRIERLEEWVGGGRAVIGILQRGDLPCSFVSPEVICEGGGSVR